MSFNWLKITIIATIISINIPLSAKESITNKLTLENVKKTDIIDNTPSEVINLTIKPLACIVENAGDNCQMTVTASWQTKQPISGCLYQGNDNIACWQKQLTFSKQFSVSLQQDMTFTLRNDLGEVVATKKIKVNTSSSTKYRRRLRAKWSLF